MWRTEMPSASRMSIARKATQLHHHQILGGARAEFQAGREFKGRGPSNYKIFEWQRAKGDVDSNAAWRLKKENSRPESELGRVGMSRRVLCEQSFDERSFVPKASE